MSVIPEPQEKLALEQRFQQLLSHWREETYLLSSSTHITAHPAYQEIIALGPAVVPLLFRELQRSRDGHLSRALASLTGAHPVPVEDRGRMEKVAEAWLKWGRENGWSW